MALLNQNWLSKLAGAGIVFITGSTRVFSGGDDQHRNQVWFAWTASNPDNFRQPHVQWVALDRANNFSLITQQQIWNPSYAFGYPELTVNSKNEADSRWNTAVGGNYENHAVGFWDDFIVYITTNSNTGTERFGDYVTIRQDPGNPALFDALGYGLDQPSPGAGATTDTHFIVFGRP